MSDNIYHWLVGREKVGVYVVVILEQGSDLTGNAGWRWMIEGVTRDGHHFTRHVSQVWPIWQEARDDAVAWYWAARKAYPQVYP